MNARDQSVLDIRLSYIKNVANLGTPDHPFTDSVKNIKRLRDYIVHSEGRSNSGEENREKLAQMVKALEGFTVGAEYIEIEKGKCEFITRQAHEWIEHLMDACGPPYKKVT